MKNSTITLYFGDIEDRVNILNLLHYLQEEIYEGKLSVGSYFSSEVSLHYNDKIEEDLLSRIDDIPGVYYTPQCVNV